MSAILNLKNYSINDRIEELEEINSSSKYIIDGIALAGQSTIIFAPPNSGKTLFVVNQLHKAFYTGALDGIEIFYLNADDSRSGLIEKAKLLKDINIHMLSPGYNNFELTMFKTLVKQIINDGESDKTCFILDTVKKFTDTMDKKMMREFGILLSTFVSSGGTLIGLGHTNKHRSNSGDLIYSGTTDLIEDCNCIYMLDVVSKSNTNESTETKTLKLYNQKLRGDNLLELNFKYTKRSGDTYKELVDSIEYISNEDFQRQEEERKAREEHSLFATEYRDAVENIVSFLSIKEKVEKGELRQHLQHNTNYGRDKCSKIIDFLDGKIIKSELGGKTNRQKLYSIINSQSI